jgi:hypothetical protein
MSDSSLILVPTLSILSSPDRTDAAGQATRTIVPPASGAGATAALAVNGITASSSEFRASARADDSSLRSLLDLNPARSSAGWARSDDGGVPRGPAVRRLPGADTTVRAAQARDGTGAKVASIRQETALVEVPVAVAVDSAAVGDSATEPMAARSEGGAWKWLHRLPLAISVLLIWNCLLKPRDRQYGGRRGPTVSLAKHRLRVEGNEQQGEDC